MNGRLSNCKTQNQMHINPIYQQSKNNAASYNLAEAILNNSERGGFSDIGLTGLARDQHNELCKQTTEAPNGFYVPFSALAGRDLSATSNAGGKYSVQTDISSNVVEILRPNTLCARLGVQTLAGLSGNFSIPTQTGKCVSTSALENSQVSATSGTFGQIQMTPHRLAVRTIYSKQLLRQSSISISNFVQQDIAKTLAVEIDRQIFQGSGASNEVAGLTQASGVGSVTFGGAATYAKMIAFETAVAAANATGPMAYVMDSATRAKLKQAPKIGSTFPTFLWEQGNFTDGSGDGVVNCQRAAVTNLIANGQVFFGNFQNIMLGVWGLGADLCVDGFTLADKNQIAVTATIYIDVAVLQPGAFAISTDSGAQ